MKKILDFPLKTHQLDLQSAYQRVTGTAWTGHFVRKELITGKSSQKLIPSFELAFASLLKSIERQLTLRGDDETITSIVDQRNFYPKMRASIKQIRENKAYQVKVIEKPRSQICRLNNFLIYETLLLPQQLLQSPISPSQDIKEYNMFSDSSIKRKLITNRSLFKTLMTPLQRVVRIHCIFDTNLKIQIYRGENSSDLAFGSLSLNQDSIEQRLCVFENRNFSNLNQPMLQYQEKTDWLIELLENLNCQSTTNENQYQNVQSEETDFSVISKKYQRSISRKKQELKNDDTKKGNDKINIEDLSEAAISDWKIVDVDYWLGGNLPYLR